MAKNLMCEICKMLGVEIGEKFKIKGDGHTYSIKLDGLHSDQYAMEDDYATLLDLLCGKAEIVKKPWKPKEEEHYYTFTSTYKYTKWKIGLNCWHTEPQNLAFLKAGWVFRTRQEAEAALPKAAAEMGVEYEI